MTNILNFYQINGKLINIWSHLGNSLYSIIQLWSYQFDKNTVSISLDGQNDARAKGTFLALQLIKFSFKFDKNSEKP
jgi:hypothetical protein